MRGPRRAATAVALTVGVMTGTAPLAATPVGADPVGWPLDVARQAAASTAFAGTVSVEWTDNQGGHSTRLTVHGAGGVIYLDGAMAVVSAPGGRLVLQPGGWNMVAPGDPLSWGTPPPVGAKFSLTSFAGPSVAGRPTTLIDFHTVRGDTEERLFLDTETGMVLRREQIDNGETVRIVAFTSIHVGLAAAEPTPPVHRDDRPKQLPASGLAAPYLAVAELANGYALVGTFRSQGVVQVVYSDGLHSLSIFEQDGTLDIGHLPRNGDAVTLRAGKATRYTWPGGQLITWQSGAVTYTAVGDGPPTDVLAAAASVPPARRLSSMQRLRSTCRRLLQQLTGRA